MTENTPKAMFVMKFAQARLTMKCKTQWRGHKQTGAKDIRPRHNIIAMKL